MTPSVDERHSRGGGYGGIINMAPGGGGVPFAMSGRAMLGRVRLVRRGF